MSERDRHLVDPSNKPSFAKAVRWLRDGIPGYDVYDEVLRQMIPLDSPFPQEELADKLTPTERLLGAILGRYPSEEVLSGRTEEYYKRQEEIEAVGLVENHLRVDSVKREFLSNFTGTALKVVEYLLGTSQAQTDEEISSELGITVEEVKCARQEAVRVLREMK